MSAQLKPETPSVALVHSPDVSANRLGLLRPIAQPQELMQHQNEQRAFITAVLKDGRDYGKIPGVDKPSLLKPGAERVNNGFGVVPRFRVVAQEIDHHVELPWLKRKKVYANGKPTGEWTEERGNSIGLYRYVVECELVHRDSGTVVAQCIGSCSTTESKYVDRPRDSENTVLKMAEKRAYVGATLLAYGLSDQFTQDVEETPERYSEGAAPPQSAGPNSSVVEPEAICPKCEGRMWDNRGGKKNPKSPDFKCRDKNCDGVYWPGQWPPKAEQEPAATSAPAKADEDRKFKGKRLGEYSDAELRSIIQACRQENATKHEALISACARVLESRPGAAQQNLTGDDPLPF